ncbi:COG1470 family protein, partial [Cellulomonas triticagri]
RRATAVLLLLAALTAGGASPATATTDPAADPAAAAARTTWALEPGTPEGPDGRVSFRHAVDPGTEVTDHVTLTNFSDHPAAFDVYAGDGLITADGQFDLPPTGTTAEAAGSWIALGDAAGTVAEPGTVQRVEVGPGAQAVLPFVVRVPADVTPGDHPAGIVAALAAEPGSGVALDSRVGARLHLRVTGDIAPALAVHDVTTTFTPSWNPFAPGTLRVDYTVANTGNVRLGAEATASAAGPFGLAGAEATGPALREVLPGGSARGSVEVAAWPLVRLGGDVDVTPAVVGEDEVTAALAAAGATWSAWAVPWLQLGLVALLVGVVLAVRQARGRREAATQRRIDAAVAAARG